MNMSQATASLVLRARAGDQNAMGMIAMVAKAAKKKGGSMRAKVAYRMLQKYIEKHPASKQREAIVGEELAVAYPEKLLVLIAEPQTFFNCFRHLCAVQSGILAAIVALSNGPSLSVSSIASMASHIPTGVGAKEALDALDEARRMQLVRDPRVPVGAVYPLLGWELGE